VLESEVDAFDFLSGKLELRRRCIYNTNFDIFCFFQSENNVNKIRLEIESFDRCRCLFDSVAKDSSHLNEVELKIVSLS
jgi:hypothetical protein